jgi:hypothetical protein
MTHNRRRFARRGLNGEYPPEGLEFTTVRIDYGKIIREEFIHIAYYITYEELLQNAPTIEYIKGKTKFASSKNQDLIFLDSIGMLDKIEAFAITWMSGPDFPVELLAKMTSLKRIFIGSTLHDEPELDKNFIEIMPELENIYQRIYDSIPSSVEYFYTKIKNFNYQLRNLPPGIKVVIIISLEYNQPVDFFPASVEGLYLHCKDFNQPLAGIFPRLNSLHLVSHVYDQELPNLSNIQHLKLKLNGYRSGWNISY